MMSGICLKILLKEKSEHGVVYYYIDQFHMLNHLCVLGTNPTWSRYV